MELSAESRRAFIASVELEETDETVPGSAAFTVAASETLAMMRKALPAGAVPLGAGTAPASAGSFRPSVAGGGGAAPAPLATLQPQPPEPTSDDQAFVVGSGALSFAKSLPADERDDVMDSTLFAQLAANKKYDWEVNPDAWYAYYWQILNYAGWVVTGMGEGSLTSRDISQTVEQEIIAVIQAALGGIASAAALVARTLKALSDAARNGPAITLFRRRSEKYQTANCQIALAAGDGEIANLTFAGFRLDFTVQVVQVLFFTFTSKQARLRQNYRSFALNPKAYAVVKDDIRQRLQTLREGLITEIELEA